MTEKDLIERIESGNGEGVQLRDSNPHLQVALREERLTVRLSREEMETLDQGCQRLGVGRSTLVRIMIREALGLAGPHAFAAASMDRG